MKAWHPERKEAVRFLQIVTDSRRTPVLVQGWSKEDAIRAEAGIFGSATPP